MDFTPIEQWLNHKMRQEALVSFGVSALSTGLCVAASVATMLVLVPRGKGAAGLTQGGGLGFVLVPLIGTAFLFVLYPVLRLFETLEDDPPAEGRLKRYFQYNGDSSWTLMFIAPIMLHLALGEGVRGVRLLFFDAHRCAPMLRLLAQHEYHVPAATVEALALPSERKAAMRDLSGVPGVCFIKKEPKGYVLTDSTREELAALLAVGHN